MTLSTKLEIIKLKENGKSYKEIAEIYGVSKSTISTIVQRNKADEANKCICCGSRIKIAKIGRKRKFCSNKCKKIWWKEHGSHSKGIEVTCKNCGIRFVNYESRSRYFCSCECYFAFRRKDSNNE